MKIGELSMRCGECGLIDHCDGPFSEVAICTEKRLSDIDEDTFFIYLESSKLPGRDTLEEKQAVIDDAYERLIQDEKQTPKNITRTSLTESYKCPTCQSERYWKDGLYCKDCGQKLKW